MSWAKLDDGMGEHRKVTRALRKSRPAVALHFLGILHCSRYLTDGFVEDEYIEEVLPARERKAALDVLVAQGLWEVADGGYAIHDYLDHNPSREKVLKQRASDAERKARGRSSDARGRPDGIRKESDGSPAGQTPDSSDRPTGVRLESVRGGSTVPSRPVPSTTSKTPKPPNGGVEEQAVALGFDEWLADHHAVTGKTIAAPGTMTRTKLAGQYVACCKEVPQPPLQSLKLATRAAHADPHRLENGYDGAENVLRPTKVLGLVDNGRRIVAEPRGDGFGERLKARTIR